MEVRGNVKQLVPVMAVMLVILGLFTACGKSAEQQIAKQLELGNKYLTEADYEAAIVVFNKVITLDEKNAVGYIGLMEAYQKSGNIDEAIQYGESGLEKNDEDSLKNKLLEVYQKKQLEAEGDDLLRISIYRKMLQLDSEQESVYLELAALYETQHDYEQSMEVLRDGLGNVANPENLRLKLRQTVDSCKEHLLDTIEGKFNVEIRGTSFRDYNGDKNYELFAIGKVIGLDEENIYYCGNSGKICEQVYTINLQENNPGCAFCDIEYQGQTYFCPYFDTEGYIFGIEDGMPFTLAENLKVSDGEVEKIEAYFTEVVAQKYDHY